MRDEARRNITPPCSLNMVIADVREQLKEALEQHNITLSVRLPRVVTIHVPYGTAMRALKTILDNANEALQNYQSEEPKQILIEVVESAEEGKIYCDVSDNGPGVSEDVLRTLFSGVAESSKPGSKGVGLLFAKLSLDRWGSDIYHRERAGHRGALFRIEFPIFKAPANGDGAGRNSEVMQ